MSKIGDFVIWCEEKGYCEYNTSTEEYDWNKNKTQSEIWKEYNETK